MGLGLVLDWPVIGLGLVAGFLAAILGLGGGFFIVPILPLLAPINHREAVATSLFTIFWTAVNNAIGFHVQGLVRWHYSIRFGLASVLGAMASASAARVLDVFWLRLVLLTVFIYSLFVAVRGLDLAKAHDHPSGEVISPQPWWRLGPMGVLAGLVSGMTGIGSGIILNPFMIRRHFVKVTEVSPTASGTMILTTLAASLIFLFGSAMGNATGPQGKILINPGQVGLVHLDLSFNLLLGTIVSSWIGRLVQMRVSSILRYRLLMLVLGGVAVKVLVDLVLSRA